MTAAVAMLISLAAATTVAGAVRENGFVGYVQQQDVAFEASAGWPGLRIKRLSADSASGRLAAYAEFPAGWHRKIAAVAQSLDIVMLDGVLQFGAETLQPYDFAFVPPMTAPPKIASPSLAHALLFFDPPAKDASALSHQRQRGAYVTHFSESGWQDALLAKRAGATADLRIFNLKKDADTGARTWYVKVGAAMIVPWEVHSVVEEGYLMRGAYRLSECLPDRTVIGDYAAGGYFWRPGGIAHSGPDSGPKSASIWLQRSQQALDVTFYQQCQDGRALSPLVR